MYGMFGAKSFFEAPAQTLLNAFVGFLDAAL